ncbi:hypothetical protein I4U23_016535 [Adineta vaga]|nr:hypothetical protein I4U23_016535 [Adineta vaga]
MAPRVENVEKQRESSRLEWAQSSCTGWIYLMFFSYGQRRFFHYVIDVQLLMMILMIFLLSINLLHHFKDYIPTILLLFPYILTRLVQPWLIREIILYIQDQSILPMYRIYLYAAAALCLCAILYGTLHQHIEFQNTRIGMCFQTALSCAIYKHLLTVSTEAFHKTTTAKVINIIVNDTSKFQEFCFFVYALLLAPLEAIGAFVLIWWFIGFPTVFGFAIDI